VVDMSTATMSSESSPNLTKIILWPFKVATDKELQTLPSSIRKKQHGQDGYAKEDDKSIDWETGRAAKADNNLSQYANNKKVCPGQ